MPKCATRDLLRAVLPVLSKKPAASMDEIADAVHLGRATLFRRFGSRDGLIRALMLESYAIGREIMEPLLTMRAPAEERLALAVAGLVLSILFLVVSLVECAAMILRFWLSLI